MIRGEPGGSPATPARRIGDRIHAAVERVRRRSPRAALDLAERGIARLGDASRRAPRPGPIAWEWQRARLVRAAGHALRGLGRHAEAARRYAEAARLFTHAGDAREAARCAIGRVDALMYGGAYARAQQEGAAAWRTLKAARDGAAAARLLTNLANLEYRQDRLAHALELYARARRALRRHGPPAAVGRVDANRANCLAVRGRPAEAARLFRSARRAFHGQGLALEVAACDYALAYVLFLQHRYAEALFAMAGLERVFDRLGAGDYRALLDLDSAEIYLRMGRPADAETAAARAAERCGGLGLRYERSKALYFEAVAAASRGAFVRAQSQLAEALAGFKAEGNPTWVGQTLLALGECRLAAGRSRQAGRLAARATRLFLSSGDLERQGLAWVLVARAALAAGEPAGAALRRAARAAARSRSPFLRFRVACAAGDAAMAAGAVAPARRAYARAVRISESLAAQVRTELFRATDWSAWEEAYPRLAAVEMAAGRAARVFRILERGRVRAFELTAEGEPGPARVGVSRPASVERRLRALACRLEARHGGRAVGGADPLIQDPLRRQEEDLEVARLLERMDRELSFRAGAHAQPPPGLDEVRGALAEDETLVEYFEAGGRIGALVVTRRGARLVPDVAGAAEVDLWLEEIGYLSRAGMRSAPGAEQALTSALEEASGRLLARVLPVAGAGLAALRRALIVPSGRMAALPWPAMMREAAGRDAVASAVPSAGFWLRRRRARDVDGPVVIVGVADERAPEVRKEIEMLSRLMPGARVLAGRSATVARVTRALAGASWLHVAGHGYFDAERPLLSGVRLFDRWANLTDLAPSGRGPRTVVLAGCQTGEIVGGWRNDWQGLAGGLLRKGSRTVLASIWDADDAGARRTAVELYGRLVGGETMGEALSGAQATLAGDGRQVWHSWTWGLFGLADARFPTKN